MSSAWESHYSEEHKLHFYYNTETQVTTWDCPPGFVQGQNDPIPIQRSCSFGDWTAHFDPNRKLPYFHNEVTNVVTWDKPEGFVLDLEFLQEYGLPISSTPGTKSPAAVNTSSSNESNEQDPVSPAQNLARMSFSTPSPQPTTVPVPEPAAEPRRNVDEPHFLTAHPHPYPTSTPTDQSPHNVRFASPIAKIFNEQCDASSGQEDIESFPPAEAKDAAISPTSGTTGSAKGTKRLASIGAFANSPSVANGDNREDAKQDDTIAKQIRAGEAQTKGRTDEEAERQTVLADEKQRHDAEQARLMNEKEAEAAAAEEKKREMTIEKKRLADEERKRVADEERKRVADEERKRVADEERKRVTDEERKRLADEERKRVEMEEAQAHAEALRQDQERKHAAELDAERMREIEQEEVEKQRLLAIEAAIAEERLREQEEDEADRLLSERARALVSSRSVTAKEALVTATLPPTVPVSIPLVPVSIPPVPDQHLATLAHLLSVHSAQQTLTLTETLSLTVHKLLLASEGGAAQSRITVVLEDLVGCVGRLEGRLGEVLDIVGRQGEEIRGLRETLAQGADGRASTQAVLLGTVVSANQTVPSKATGEQATITTPATEKVEDKRADEEISFTLPPTLPLLLPESTPPPPPPKRQTLTPCTPTQPLSGVPLQVPAPLRRMTDPLPSSACTVIRSDSDTKPSDSHHESKVIKDTEMIIPPLPSTPPPPVPRSSIPDTTIFPAGTASGDSVRSALGDSVRRSMGATSTPPPIPTIPRRNTYGTTSPIASSVSASSNTGTVPNDATTSLSPTLSPQSPSETVPRRRRVPPPPP